MRISYSKVPIGQLSVMAQQSGDTFTNFDFKAHEHKNGEADNERQQLIEGNQQRNEDERLPN